MRDIRGRSLQSRSADAERRLRDLEKQIWDIWPLVRRGTDAGDREGIQDVGASSGGAAYIDPAVLLTTLTNKGSATARLYVRGPAGWIQTATTVTVYGWLTQQSSLPAGREIWIGWHQKLDLSTIRVVLEAACITGGALNGGSSANGGLMFMYMGL